ncbi:adhesion G-protein coupled receptor G6 [Musca domestica]|uniref:Adhesion G-protein coupled receptor G6 n=1 Tax=Musca domestica TaxID=7370 RepID=A0ABM3V1Y6_MUSDO|nr:adhesion G-protein coupled receptor G6 [Musca domestica]
MNLFYLTILLCFEFGENFVQRGIEEVFTKVSHSCEKGKRSFMCESQSFEISYLLLRDGLTQRKTNSWPAARTGELVRPTEFCLLPTGLPLVRKCNSIECTAEWEEMNYGTVTCIGYEDDKNALTFELQKLYKEIRHLRFDRISFEITSYFLNLLNRRCLKLTAADLEISLSLLRVITRSRNIQLLPQIVEIANFLLQSDDDATAKFNQLSGTPALLITLENYLIPMAKSVLPPQNCRSNFADGKHFGAENIKVFYTWPMCSDVTGIVVYKKSRMQSLKNDVNYDFQYIYLNQSFNDLLLQSNVDVVAYVPQELWKMAKKKRFRLKFSWYKNSNFFLNHTASDDQEMGSALLPAIYGNKDLQPKYIPLPVDETNSNGHFQCFQWQGSFWRLAQPTTVENSTYLALCRNRVKATKQLSLESDKSTLSSNLNILRFVRSIIGCILSLFGLFCIFLTALFYDNWRHQFSNKLLLNISAILLLVTSYFMLLNMPNIRAAIDHVEHPKRCIAVGAFFQYSMLVLFLWMLFIAVLQYKRYVRVFAAKVARHTIVGYALAAWCLPLIPTLLVTWLDSQSYMRSLHDRTEGHFMCHPSGFSWLLGILLPASSIMLICFGIFGYILWNIRRASKKFHSTLERDDVILHVHRSAILILVLSITWIFGLLGHMETFGFFEVLFCFTSTLQGFFLFAYFVVMDKNARQFWRKYLCAGNYSYSVE